MERLKQTISHRWRLCFVSFSKGDQSRGSLYSLVAARFAGLSELDVSSFHPILHTNSLPCPAFHETT